MKHFFILLVIFLSLGSSAQETMDYYFYDDSVSLKNDAFLVKKNIISYKPVLDSLMDAGFFMLEVKNVLEDNMNGKQQVILNLGENFTNIYLKENDEIREITISKFQRYKDSILLRKTNDGYPFARVQSKFMGQQNNIPIIELNLFEGDFRKMDQIIWKDFRKIPLGFERQLIRKYQKAAFTDKLALEIHEEINNHPYIELQRESQVLFQKDSTLLYVYAKKVKTNHFDGLVGFSNNNEGDFKLNGNVQLQLNNNFNGFERLHLHWVATADEFSRLNIQVETPFLFKTPLGNTFDLFIDRQDSTFVNTKIGNQVFWQLNAFHQIGINFRYENLNAISMEVSNIEDIQKTGWGINYRYSDNMNARFLEPNFYGKMLVQNLNGNERSQYEIGFEASKIQKMHEQHYVKLKTAFAGLFNSNESDNFFNNELFRVGGFKTNLRGFNEQSIFTNLFWINTIEYRFSPQPAIFFSAFLDYGYAENQIINNYSNLLGTGVGISLRTGLGFLNLNYAVGKSPNTSFDFRNAKIHIGLITAF